MLAGSSRESDLPRNRRVACYTFRPMDLFGFDPPEIDDGEWQTSPGRTWGIRVPASTCVANARSTH